MDAKKSNIVSIASNKKAFFDYDIIEKIEAGIMLRGYEVKSVKAGKVNLKGSYVSIFSDGPFVTGMHISAYEPAKVDGYDPIAKRKILLNGREIESLIKYEQAQGLTIVPLEIYVKKGLIKLLIGVVKGRKKYDKRENLKKKSQNLEVNRALKRYK